MRKETKKKKITILHNGPIRLKGGVRGPIIIPYMEEVSMIGKMLLAGYKVIEHLASGKTVELNFQNYNKENGNGDMKLQYEAVQSPTELKSPKQPKPTPGNGVNVAISPIMDVYENR